MSHYLVEFGPPQSGEQVTLDQSALQLTGWRSIGNPNGVTFVNATTQTIESMYIKTNNTEDRFVLNPDSLGGVFEDAWISPDGSELLLVGAEVPTTTDSKGASIPSSVKFWMRVPPTPPCQTNECDTNNSNPASCPFTGQLNSDLQPGQPGWISYNSL